MLLQRQPREDRGLRHRGVLDPFRECASGPNRCACLIALCSRRAGAQERPSRDMTLNRRFRCNSASANAWHLHPARRYRAILEYQIAEAGYPDGRALPVLMPQGLPFLAVGPQPRLRFVIFPLRVIGALLGDSAVKVVPERARVIENPNQYIRQFDFGHSAVR